MIETSRRSLLIGFTGLVAAPAIVRASSIMRVKAPSVPQYWMGSSGFYTDAELGRISDEFTAAAVKDALDRMARAMALLMG